MAEKRERVVRDAVIMANGLKVACYRVFDPEKDDYGPRQYHMTWGDTVLAVMGEEAAKLFSRFVTDFVSDEPTQQKTK